MTKVLKINKSVGEGVQELLKFLLKSGKVKGVFTLRKINDNGAVAYSLITGLDMLKDAMPFFPLMPANAGKLLSSLTVRGSVTEPVVAVVRPCELRAFIELVKRKQGSLENLLLVSSTCSGVYPLETSANGNIDKKLSQYWDAIKRNEIVPDTRPTCRGCEHFLPYTADITIALIGKKDIDNQCEIFLNTEKGQQFVDGIEGEFVEGKLESEEVVSMQNKRKDEKKRLFDEIGIEKFGLKGLIETFGKCIGCHGCSKVCPICYCNLCYSDSKTYEHKPSVYEIEIKRRGGLRVPPDTVSYQIGRLTHVGISCVGCGLCADVCPANIPISTIFLKVGDSVQKMFDYLPGRDVEEQIPVTTFKTDEFVEVED
ncbi:Coenzyme F420 hydrogenase/dehydrogenase, beta subunit C-terminal domain [candidate division WOR-3 bacterium]|nr:Coenzyme F420 hydrogenase/dehydrogenase, beta subunit C-terminal domain [candidate division WOR-3 bacterium]